MHKGDSGYELTAKGHELEPILFSIAAWGELHASGPPRGDDTFRLRYLMTSVRRRLRSESDLLSLQLTVEQPKREPESYWVRLGPNPTVLQGENPADVALDLALPQLQELLFGATEPEDETLRRFQAAFRKD